MIDVRMIDCYCWLGGGALYNNGGIVAINNSRIEHCFAATGGAAIYTNNGAILTVTGTVITNTTAGYPAGVCPGGGTCDEGKWNNPCAVTGVMGGAMQTASNQDKVTFIDCEFLYGVAQVASSVRQEGG